MCLKVSFGPIVDLEKIDFPQRDHLSEEGDNQDS